MKSLPAVELLSAVGTAAILLFGGYQVVDGNVELGVLFAFVGYLQTFFDPIQQISQLYTTYQQGMAALDKIFDLLDTEPDLVDPPNAIDPGEIRGAIDLEGVWFGYGDDPERDSGWALRDIDLRILQDFGFGAGQQHNFQLSVDLLNVANLLNSDWGVRKVASSSATSPLLLTGFDANGAPVFNFTGPARTFIDDPSVYSRWRMQLGLRYFLQ
jgi:ABC-type multidrug transport system fused ATPase/permease subunit